ncbi:MAG: hypothetical protein HZC28_11385 [Spirochaetes bacterium]|nr:hypothetical protein [Spirochaetota bacterium]
MTEQLHDNTFVTGEALSPQASRGITAIALLSGGLDSQVAVKMILEQGIAVTAIKFTSPFCTCDSGGVCHSAVAAKAFNIPLVTIPKGLEYLDVVRSPEHGYGRAMNPCIDCRIFILKKAAAYAASVGAAFLFTGEVLDQRPMSQHRRALDVIEEESGLRGKLLRPLSARLLPPTEAELSGMVDRNRLGAIHGRSRGEQMALAKSFSIADYPCSAGGCLLTEKAFALRLKDLFEHNNSLEMRDVTMLKVGRHFRYQGAKVIVGKNKLQNEHLLTARRTGEVYLETLGIPGPSALLSGDVNDTTILFAAEAAASYADAGNEAVEVLIDDGIAKNTLYVIVDEHICAMVKRLKL